MTFLRPVDICNLGAASRYWRAVVRDPLLWRYFLLRDMLNWPSIDHVSMPQLEMLDVPLIDQGESLDDREEWDDKGMESTVDYMSEWVSFFSVCPCEGQFVQMRFEPPFTCLQIPERMPIQQTTMASLTAGVRGRDLISPVSGALI